MMEGSLSTNQARPLAGEDQISALFANLIIQQTNMALMLLGKLPHPDSNEAVLEIEPAKLIIDQLEMLQTKTKGNLTPQEDGLLKQSLMSLRMTFVEAVDRKSSPKAPASKSGPEAKSRREPEPNAESSPPVEEEPRKKFTKKYGSD